MNRKSIICVAFVTGAYLVAVGCVKPSAIDDFAKVSAQASQLFPAVAATAYQGCVATQKDAQLSAISGPFSSDFAFNPAAIDTACANQKQTQQRLEKSYAVLADYIQALAKLAGGKPPTYDTKVSGAVNEIPGLNSAQQTAVSGLASVILDAFTKQWREREAAKMIGLAQPHVLVITGMFDEDIPKFLDASLDNQETSLRGLYKGASVIRLDGEKIISNPILIAKSFTDADAEIQKKRAGVQAFKEIVVKIREGHTALYNARNQLSSRDAIQQVFQIASDIKKQVDALQTSLKG